MLHLSDPSAPLVQIRVCRIEEIPPGMGRSFDIAGRSIAIFRTRAGTFHATDNACPHAGAPLADGIIAGNCIVCPFHGRRFNLDSGQCDEQSLTELTTYRTSTDEDWIVVNLP